MKALTDEKEKTEASEWSLKQNLEVQENLCLLWVNLLFLLSQSAQEEVKRLYEEKTKLVSTCEELSNERDGKTQLLQRHEKVKYLCQKYITISFL